MITVLAEKPSVARDLASFLGAKTRKDGYFEGNGYSVTWAFGHLVTLAGTDDYGIVGKWNFEQLPIVPNPFKLVVGGDEGVQKQYQTIVTLFNEADELICATDSGREGELIFRYIYELSNCKKTFKRLWISSLTNEALKQGFASLKDGKDYDNLFYSARSRSQADWVVGINATRAMTIKANAGTLFSLGRVQTPTLALVAQRFLEHTNFNALTYFVAQLHLEHQKIKFVASYEKTLTSKEQADDMMSVVGKTIQCTDVIKKDIKENPPTLYDLTTLQQDANKQFSFTAQQTLDIAQALYEKHKILSYPRTSSCYLSDDLKPKITGLMLNVVRPVHTSKAIIDEIINDKLSNRPFDNNKVTDHHAIIPTEQKPNLSALTDEEQKIYFLVLDKFIQAFYKPCLKQSTQLQFKTEKGVFKSNGMVVAELGWRGVGLPEVEDDDKPSEENQKLPITKQDEWIAVNAKKIAEKKTQAPSLLTEASLLKLMETAGKTVEDEEAKHALKACGIGTPATRANIIETLVKRGFIEKKGKKQLIATPTGLAVYNRVKDLAIAKADLTGDWEKKLNLMAEGKYNAKLFDNEIITYTQDIVSHFKDNAVNIYFSKDALAVCPSCKAGSIVESPKAYGCSAWRTGCNFKVWKEIGGKNITLTAVKALFAKGKTPLIKGFTSKIGRLFDAHLVLTEKDGIVTTKFEFPEIKPMEATK